jgi:DNA-binding NtrC family response regulator/tetratricopeptide (TPR) repeat protein
MLPEPSPEVLSALQLFRRGRFFETVATLEHFPEGAHSPRRKDFLAQAVLADALHRVGRNEHAELIATRSLHSVPELSQVHARFQLVLGNVLRERGNIAKAIEHFQIAVGASGSDPEMSCWTHLRLMATIAELNGREAAIAHLEQVKRTLTRFGDARPFAALHLWFVENDTMRGHLDSARRHLKTADSLLSEVDDVWLRGYLAINGSAVHYYCAEIDEARRWAEIASACSRISGHRTTKRAAHVNLGYFELAMGQLDRAEEYFQTALKCCERGSSNEIAILDNIAETKLQRGDLDGCKLILSRLDELAVQSADANRRHYNAWILQTKVRLMLREGRKADARTISESIGPLIEESPQGRVTTECRLLSAEALFDIEPLAAAESLSLVLGATTQLAPDLFAEAELVTGKVLNASGALHLARVRLERAARTFGAIGHHVGKQRSLDELDALPVMSAQVSDETATERSLDRFRALLDFRSRPELFGYEALSLLEELKCSSNIRLVVGRGCEQRVVGCVAATVNSTESTSDVSIVVGEDRDKQVTLSFAPLADPKSKLTALSFQRILEQVLAIRSSEPGLGDREVVWTSNEGTSVKQGIVFASDAMLEVWRTVKQIAPTDVSVLITGETGTGKEVIAKTIHECSRRSAMPFLALNCAAVPKDLLESQLFGHRKGAFSGAADAHQGIVRAANKGTLFLDEIGEIPIDMQAKLLRFLEMGEVHPVGESHPIKVNVRLIFATNGNLEEAVSQNRFREDLFYRLNVIPIKVPPLRERREEIPVLANLFAQRFAAEFAKDPLRFSSSAMELLILYSWPGNIRQLANEVRRLAALTESGTCVGPEHLSSQLQAQRRRSRSDDPQVTPQMQIRIDQPLEKATADLESEMIKQALRQAGGRVSAAASALGISRKGLYLKRLRLGLTNIDDRAN